MHQNIIALYISICIAGAGPRQRVDHGGAGRQDPVHEGGEGPRPSRPRVPRDHLLSRRDPASQHRYSCKLFYCSN